MGMNMNKLNSFDKKVRTDVVSPVFADGMVVTANDLTSALHYPVELFQTLVQSFFGCGVVCGLEVELFQNAKDDLKWCVVVQPGTALDCEGYPLKICEPQKISLKPDLCNGVLPTELCIALRRCVVKEGPREDADFCDPESKQDGAYSRAREYVEIKVYDPTDCDLPELCQAEPYQYNNKQICNCLKNCPKPCCGESWVVLACVTIDEYTGIERPIDKRKFVKPVHCHCLPPPATEPNGSTTVPQFSKALATEKKTIVDNANDDDFMDIPVFDGVGGTTDSTKVESSSEILEELDSEIDSSTKIKKTIQKKSAKKKPKSKDEA